MNHIPTSAVVVSQQCIMDTQVGVTGDATQLDTMQPQDKSFR